MDEKYKISWSLIGVGQVPIGPIRYKLSKDDIFILSPRLLLGLRAGSDRVQKMRSDPQLHPARSRSPYKIVFCKIDILTTKGCLQVQVFERVHEAGEVPVSLGTISILRKTIS